MNSVFFDHTTIDSCINEDAALLDLTSHMLDVGSPTATINFVIRHDGIAACTEEVQRILEHCGAQSDLCIPSGSIVKAGDILVSGQGPAQVILRAWKVGQNLLEYACGVARLCGKMKTIISHYNPKMALLTTRKHASGLRGIALKATLSAGALPHRLGLSETILVFPQHIALLGGWDKLKIKLQEKQSGFVEKKIVIEVDTLEQAYLAIEAGAEVLQFDKVAPENLQLWVPQLRKDWPQGVFLAAGGIKLKNIEQYAKTPVDGLVTSALHYAAPADIGVNIQPAN